VTEVYAIKWQQMATTHCDIDSCTIFVVPLHDFYHWRCPSDTGTDGDVPDSHILAKATLTELT